MQKRGVSGQEAGTKSIYGTTKKRVCKITRKPLIQQFGDPNRVRTGVAGVRGQCPRPLDDGAKWWRFITDLGFVVNHLFLSIGYYGEKNHSDGRGILESLPRPKRLVVAFIRSVTSRVKNS
jgi:hypothetical protein